ncbi:hypothetical protein HYS29_00545, partial [Candidatus Microgenomates bacterium]|nr:hypothetical protein [Candidatus Microgenomates bacterium]
MREVVLGLAANTARLADHLQQALGNGNSPSDEVRAAFGVIRAVATAGEVIVTENTGVIFQTDGTDGILQEQPILPAPAPQLSEVTIPFSLPEAAPTEDTHPTTFGELFEVKLRSLVPAEVISRRKLQSLAGGIHKSWKHRVPQQKTFTNEEAISFMEKLLLTPTSHFKAKSDGYTR